MVIAWGCVYDKVVSEELQSTRGLALIRRVLYGRAARLERRGCSSGSTYLGSNQSYSYSWDWRPLIASLVAIRLLSVLFFMFYMNLKDAEINSVKNKYVVCLVMLLVEHTHTHISYCNPGQCNSHFNAFIFSYADRIILKDNAQRSIRRVIQKHCTPASDGNIK